MPPRTLGIPVTGLQMGCCRYRPSWAILWVAFTRSGRTTPPRTIQIVCRPMSKPRGWRASPCRRRPTGRPSDEGTSVRCRRSCKQRRAPERTSEKSTRWYDLFPAMRRCRGIGVSGPRFGGRSGGKGHPARAPWSPLRSGGSYSSCRCTLAWGGRWRRCRVLPGRCFDFRVHRSMGVHSCDC